MARVHLAAYRALGLDAYIFARARASELVAECGWGQALPSREALVDVVDVVDICAPTSAHLELAKFALRKGKHVIVEKPIALTVDDANHLIELARIHDRRLFPAHVLRYFPEYQALQASIARGELGELGVLDFARESASPEHAEWFKDPEQSGGVILDQMIHDIDMARWLAGPVESVIAHTTTRQTEGFHIEVAHAILHHGSGAISRVCGMWGPPSVPFRTSFSVAGQRGELHYRSRSGVAIEVLGGTSAASSLPPIDPVFSPYLAQLTDFLGAIETNSRARVNAVDGREAVRIANAARLAAASNARVLLDRVL